MKVPVAAEILGYRLRIGEGGPRRWRHRYPPRQSYTITPQFEFRRLLPFQRRSFVTFAPPDER